MMGLLISDSFKTVVTIYILIPFLVIPQIILSGIIVKYEKLNPNISSPSEIPIYGEMIAARWGYEALSVYEFLENDYQKDFNEYDKAMSIAEYRKNYWVLNLKNKADFIERSLGQPQSKDEIIHDLLVIRNEIRKEEEFNSKILFGSQDSLYIEKISLSVTSKIKDYLDKVNRYYIKLYNKANAGRDNIVAKYQQTPEDKEKFLEKKRKCYNENLSDFVTNSNEVDRIVEYKGQLFQKIDPIFMDPKSNFIKAHFYAPRKKIFGIYVHTLWVNVIVIWFMTIVLYLMLYFRVLKRLLDYFEDFSEKPKRVKT
jgi:hypothetical protein